MLNTQQADGCVSINGDGSVLEEYLDFISTLPAEARRYVTLIRDLDTRTNLELEQVQTRQNEIIELVRNGISKYSTTRERALFVEKLRQGKEFMDLVSSIHCNYIYVF